MAWEGGGEGVEGEGGGGEVTMSVAVGASHATCLATRRVPAPQVAGTDMDRHLTSPWLQEPPLPPPATRPPWTPGAPQ